MPVPQLRYPQAERPDIGEMLTLREMLEKRRREAEMYPLEVERIKAQTGASEASAAKSERDVGLAEDKAARDREQQETVAAAELFSVLDPKDEAGWRATIQESAKRGWLEPELVPAGLGATEAQRAEAIEKFRRIAVGQKVWAEGHKRPDPKGFSSSAQGIYSQDTGEITSPAPPGTRPGGLQGELADLLTIPAGKRTGEQRGRIQALQAAMQTYQYPARIPTVNEAGEAVTLFDRPAAGTEYPAGPTADMRNRQYARKLMAPTIEKTRQLSRTVITETTAIVQRAKASGMAVEAALKGHPTYQTYQAGRKALAVNLAVAKQGSRPTEADVQIELLQVPDVFSDSEEVAALKWAMLYSNALQPLPEELKTTLDKYLGGGETQTGPQQQGGVSPEGTVVEMEDGSKQIKRGGSWVPYTEGQ